MVRKIWRPTVCGPVGLRLQPRSLRYYRPISSSAIHFVGDIADTLIPSSAHEITLPSESQRYQPGFLPVNIANPLSVQMTTPTGAVSIGFQSICLPCVWVEFVSAETIYLRCDCEYEQDAQVGDPYDYRDDCGDYREDYPERVCDECFDHGWFGCLENAAAALKPLTKSSKRSVVMGWYFFIFSL